MIDRTTRRPSSGSAIALDETAHLECAKGRAHRLRTYLFELCERARRGWSAALEARQCSSFREGEFAFDRHQA